MCPDGTESFFSLAPSTLPAGELVDGLGPGTEVFFPAVVPWAGPTSTVRARPIGRFITRDIADDATTRPYRGEGAGQWEYQWLLEVVRA